MGTVERRRGKGIPAYQHMGSRNLELTYKREGAKDQFEKILCPLRLRVDVCNSRRCVRNGFTSCPWFLLCTREDGGCSSPTRFFVSPRTSFFLFLFVIGVYARWHLPDVSVGLICKYTTINIWNSLKCTKRSFGIGVFFFFFTAGACEKSLRALPLVWMRVLNLLGYFCFIFWPILSSEICRWLRHE